jgi:hypothetical protein
VRALTHLPQQAIHQGLGRHTATVDGAMERDCGELLEPQETVYLKLIHHMSTLGHGGALAGEHVHQGTERGVVQEGQGRVAHNVGGR